jgi:hypothetical protein
MFYNLCVLVLELQKMAIFETKNFSFIILDETTIEKTTNPAGV